MTVGDRIKDLRERLGMSQGDLAKKMGISRQAVSKAENHGDNITTPKVSKYAKALGCTEAYLMGWEDNETYNELVDAYEHKLEQEEDIRKAALIIAYLNQLNEEGFQEAIKRIQELTELNKYRKDN